MKKTIKKMKPAKPGLTDRSRGEPSQSNAEQCNIRDMTERKRLPESVRHSRDLLLALSRVAQSVQQARTPEEIYRAVGEQIKVLGLGATVLTFDHDGKHLIINFTTFAAHLVRAGEKLLGFSVRDYRLPISPKSIYGRIIASEKAEYVHSTDDLVAAAIPKALRPLAGQLARVLKIEHGIIAPLRLDDVALGMLTLSGSGLSQEDVPAVEVFAAQVAISLRNARLTQQAQDELAERKRAEEALRESAERFRSILDNIEDGYYEVDPAGNFTFFNPALVRMLGRPAQKMMGMNNRRYMTSAGARTVFQTFNRVFRTGIPEQALGWELVRPDGTLRSIEVSVSLNKAADGSIHGFRGTVRDITERKRAEEQLRESEERLRTIVEGTHALLVSVDANGHFTYANDATARAIGYPSPKELIGKSYLHFVHPKDRQQVLATFINQANTHQPSSMQEFRIIDTHGTVKWFSFLSTLAIKDGQVVGQSGVAQDITARKRADDELRHLSIHDMLTGMYNRTFFEETMARLERGRDFPISIIMADVDRLKDINDNLGHAAGDAILQRVAQVMKTAFRADDVIARIGGDEFAVILPGSGSAAADVALRRVRQVLQEHNAADPGTPISISFGASTALQRAPLFDVLKEADAKMYREKRSDNAT